MKKWMLTALLLAAAAVSRAQTKNDFCGKMGELIEAAKEKVGFTSMRGKLVDSSAMVSAWRCTVQLPVPGGDTAHVLNIMNSGAYQCYLLNSAAFGDVQPVYEQYRKMLAECLPGKDMVLQISDNYNEELANYPKATYQKPESEEYKKEHEGSFFAESGRPLVILEVSHTKYDNRYKVMLTIYQ